MIAVDPRIGSKELLPLLRRRGVIADLAPLEFGDVCFEGKGPKGTALIGIERKKLADILSCVDDARYAGHQRPGMMRMYDKSFLLIEGLWRPHDPSGTLMEGFNGGQAWKELRYRSQRVMYEKLRRYLFSVSLSGVIVLYTRDITHTAFDIVECYHYFQKRWEDHRSLLETQKLNLPALFDKPSLVRKWAADIEGVGVVHSMAAERIFKKPIDLAQADESEWMKVKGIGPRSAQSIVRQVRGIKR